MKITVQIKTVYGVEQVYPACQRSRLFAEIAGTKTLTAETLRRSPPNAYRRPRRFGGTSTRLRQTARGIVAYAGERAP